jgi:signal transduction histidine kinase
VKLALKHPWPDTLVGRTLLVLLVGLLLSQVAGVALYSVNRLELANTLDSRHVADRIAGVVHLVEQTPEGERSRVIHAMDLPGLRIGWGQSPLIVESDGEADPGSEVIAKNLLQRLAGHEIYVTVRERPPPAPIEGPEPGVGLAHAHHPPTALATVRLDDGSWLNFVVPLPPPGEPLWRPRFFAPLGLGLLVVMLLSVLAVRRSAKPLAVLAAAAQRLGRDVAAPPVPVEGPREVREAAQAFNEMQTRLRRFVEDRTQMIAAISHDLRTPITRLKLRAEFVEDDEQRAKMLVDLDEMEAMIASTLTFARDDASREKRRELDLAALLQDLCVEFDATYEGPEDLAVTGGPIGLKRAFTNLLDNARKYAGAARVILVGGADQITVGIEDDGPGIPPAELERVFQPFHRVETSRNRDTGGTGLGLAVARSAVRAQGGDIHLSNRATGGLKATVTLPR